MASNYRVDVKNTAGVIQAVITDFQDVQYVKKVNEPGLMQISLRGNHPALPYFTDKAQIEVWRQDAANGLDWYCDFYGMVREPDRRDAGPGQVLYLCTGQMGMLDWRIVGWKAGTASRSQFTSQPAETIAKTLVDYNAASNATVANGRIREGVITGITVAADAAGGNVIDWFCAYDNLLKSLQDVARIGGGDFDLVKTGAATWEFRWYAGQLGSDLSSTVIFAVEFDNMIAPRFRIRRLGERTAVIVGGEGEGAARSTVVRTGPNYSASNDLELFVDARNITTTAGLNARGDEVADKYQSTTEFEFEAKQTPAYLYGRDYGLGDLVTVRNPYTAENLTRKIVGVTVRASEQGDERVQIDTSEQ